MIIIKDGMPPISIGQYIKKHGSILKEQKNIEKLM
jgi:hypothetical protein